MFQLINIIFQIQILSLFNFQYYLLKIYFKIKYFIYFFLSIKFMNICEKVIILRKFGIILMNHQIVTKRNKILMNFNDIIYILVIEKFIL
jgi:hypothetical protein